MRYLLFLTMILFACSVQNQGARIKAEKGEINILKNGDYVVKYQNSTTILKNVRTFLWFNQDPYFELDDGRILKWTNTISDKSFNLQKVYDNLYFLKQYSSGVEIDNISLNIINQQGAVSQILLPTNTENIGVFDGRYMVEKSYYEFCVVNKYGKILSCYKWPDIKEKE